MHDYDNYRFYINDEEIVLTENQNELLRLFIDNKKHIVTFEKIIYTLRYENYKVYMRPSITRAVDRLKKKCKLHISPIYTKGYILRGMSDECR